MGNAWAVFSAGLFVLPSEKQADSPWGGTAFADALLFCRQVCGRELQAPVSESDSSSLYRVSIYTAALDIIVIIG